MAGKNTAAFGIYSTRAGVENAVDMLKAEGYRNTDISVLFPENEGTKDFAIEKNTKASENAVAGASGGAVIGGGLAWLVLSGAKIGFWIGFSSFRSILRGADRDFPGVPHFFKHE